MDYCWSFNMLAIWCEELIHWKRPWCWERLKERGEGDNRGWDGWMVTPTQWTWVWASSGRWWWTGKPGVLQSTGSQRVGHDWATDLKWLSHQPPALPGALHPGSPWAMIHSRALQWGTVFFNSQFLFKGAASTPPKCVEASGCDHIELNQAVLTQFSKVNFYWQLSHICFSEMIFLPLSDSCFTLKLV